MNLTWHYLVNQFLNATKENYKKALKLSNYHDAYLFRMMTENPGDPDWTTLYNRYHPFHLAFVSEYNKWKAAGGVQKGQTLNLDQYLVLLVSKINKWDAQIQSVTGFEKGTVNYLTIFPQGYKPYNSGAKTARANSVSTLSEILIPFALANPAIATIKAEVDTFASSIDTARDTQESAKGGTKQKSEEVENKRVITMTEQYRDLGFLINKSAEDPERIAPFFELQVLRSHDQVLFTGTLDANENEAVLTHSFVADDELEFEITTTETVPASTQVAFYLGSTAGGTDSNPVFVGVNQAKLKIQAAAFNVSDYGTHRFLTAVNNSTFELHYKVELL
ncbi:MAG: hypothetical protein POELPBGB_00949 [Bacteroidia bacterium]|nr:hypothetical protein [Bacteroidia bacterium]